MNIQGFKVDKKLFSTGEGLTVFSARTLESNDQCMIRLIDYSNTNDNIDRSTWYTIYGTYQMEISNFKFLPRVTTIAMVDVNKLYSVLEIKDGKTLKKKGEITISQIEHLLEAVRHLHSKKIPHGSINSNNIWITEKQGIPVLYGAQEIRALSGEVPNIQRDLIELVNVIKYFSTVNESIIEDLENDKSLTLNQISLKIEEAKKLDPRKKKPKLVETNKQPVNPPSIPETKNEENDRRNIEREEESKPQTKQENDEDNNKNDDHSREEKNKKSSSKFWKAIAGFLAVAVIVLLITMMMPSEKEQKNVAIQSVVEAKETKTKQTEAREKEPASIKTKPADPIKTELSVKYSTDEVEKFMIDYSKYSIQAVNESNFALVENLVDINGKAYIEQKDYIDYLKSKGITEESQTFKVKEILQVDQNTFNVMTYEKYHIYYGDGTEKIKEFNSKYILKILEDGRLAVHELVSSEEISSQVIQTAQNDYDTDYTEDFETENYGDGYNDDYSFDPATTDDRGAIESIVRLHYASITNDDFSRAYNLFSSEQKKKFTQKGWEKGLQQNLSDEITYIQVEQLEPTTGRVYIEMTSYDDNRDGTTLVQDWNGYWLVVKENGRWVLDVPDINKTNSRVE